MKTENNGVKVKMKLMKLSKIKCEAVGYNVENNESIWRRNEENEE